MNTPPSSFEHDMILIAEEYPDLLRKYDHAIEILLHMQRIVVCAYERTKPDTHTDTNIVIQYYNWDVAAWELVEGAFKDPLPNMESWVYRECAAELGTFVDYNECLERVVEGKNDWLVEVVGVGRFLQDWVHEFVYGRDGEDDDEDEYSEDEYDEENVEKDDEDHEEENEHECEDEDVDEEDKGNDVEEEDKEDESVENEGKDREVDQEAGPRDEDDERQDEAKDEEVQEEENVVDDDKEEDKEEGENEDEGEVYYADDDWDFCEC